MLEQVSRPLKSIKPAEGSMFIRDVDRIDCAVFVPSRGIVGHSWYTDIEIKGQLGREGFVYDFSLLKKLVKKILKDSVDHALLIPIQSDLVHFSRCKDGEHWQLQCKNSKEVWEYICPSGSVFPIQSKAITKEQLEREISRLVKHRLPGHINSVSINLRDEEINETEAYFHYTHGIREHDGLCQRTFHGHKSKLEVFYGDERRVDLEHYITRSLFGNSIHIASDCQITNGETTNLKPNENSSILTYESSMGYYEARIPNSRLFKIPSKTSIEAISNQLANLIKDKLAKEYGQLTKEVRVIAYEGIGKGAISTH